MAPHAGPVPRLTEMDTTRRVRDLARLLCRRQRWSRCAAVLQRPIVAVVGEVEEIRAICGARDDGVARGGGHHFRRLGAHERAVRRVGDDVNDMCLGREVGVSHGAMVLPLRHVHVGATVRAVANGCAPPRPCGLRRGVRVARVLRGARRGQQVQRSAMGPAPRRVARALRAGVAHARQLAIIVGLARATTFGQHIQPRALREHRRQQPCEAVQ